ncbi:MAG: 50S ribosomal protein L9 [Proteobacteria bacterium]|nr:50S ribosomal protein L9 [Pseudomonadota bacterium]
MEVILLERINRLGQMGDVVNVKPGFARNFLLPQKKALRATEANKKHFEAERAQLETSNLENRSEAEKLGKKMDGLSVIMIRQAGESGQLYGSVNARDIANGVTEAGFTITRQQIELAHPIKSLGLFDVRVVLHPEVRITVVANIARSVGEANTQTKTGVAMVGTDADQAKAAMTSKAGENDAEFAADEAVVEQAAKIFEEGAAPRMESEDAAADGATEESAEDSEEKSK